MHPIVTVLEVGGVSRPLGSYGVMLAAAILVGGALTVRAAVRARIDAGLTIATLGYVCAGSFIGAFGLFAMVEGFRTGDFTTALRQPGLVFYGGAIGGALALALSCRAFGLPLGKLADLAVPAIATAHALGRIGCFLGGCCFGAASDGPLAVLYTHPFAPAAHPSIPRHPTPLYEAFFLLVLALLFALTPTHRLGRGRRFLVYVLSYGGLRFAVEFFRGDSVRGVLFDGALSTSQIIAVVVALVALLALVGLRNTRALPTTPRQA